MDEFVSEVVRDLSNEMYMRKQHCALA